MALPPIIPSGDLAPSDNDMDEGRTIKCAARDCKYNSSGKCTTDISVSAGPSVSCETYEKSGPTPMPPPPTMAMSGPSPMPPMPMGM